MKFITLNKKRKLYSEYEDYGIDKYLSFIPEDYQNNDKNIKSFKLAYDQAQYKKPTVISRDL